MLDTRSRAVLTYLLNECSDGGYHVVESEDIKNSLPKNEKVDNVGIINSIIHLENQNYVSVKYKDDKKCCVAVLPYALDVIQTETLQKQRAKKYVKMGSMLYLLVFVFAFLGSFFAIMFYGFIF